MSSIVQEADQTEGPIESIIAALYARIESILPIKSGMSVSQIESDHNYKEAKNHLCKVADSMWINDIAACTANTIEHINQFDNNAPIEERKPTSIASLELILSLLVDFINVIWSKHHSNMDSDKETSSENSELALSQANISSRLFFKPRKISRPIAKKLISLLSDLKTQTCCIQAVQILTSNQSYTAKFSEYERKDIQKIDGYCDDIVKYLAASNASEFFEFLENKYRRIGFEALFVPRSDFIGLAYLDSDNVLAYLKIVKSVIQLTTRQSQQNLILYWSSESIYNWAVTRTRDFLTSTKSMSVNTQAESLFDYVYKFAEVKAYSLSVYRFLATVLLLAPVAYEKYLDERQSKSSTLTFKRSVGRFSSKHRFLNDLTQIFQKSPSSTDSLIKVMLVGSSLSLYEPHHPLGKFASNTYDQLRLDLSMDNMQYYPSNLEPELVDSYRIEVYAAGFMLRPKKLTLEAIDAFQNYSSKPICLSNITGGIKTLVNKLTTGKFMAYLKTLFPYMLSTLQKLSIQNTTAYAVLETDSLPSNDSSESVVDIRDALQQSIVAKSAQTETEFPTTPTTESEMDELSASASNLQSPTAKEVSSRSISTTTHATELNSTMLKNVYKTKNFSSKVIAPLKHTLSTSSSSLAMASISSAPSSVPSTYSTTSGPVSTKDIKGAGSSSRRSTQSLSTSSIITSHSNDDAPHLIKMKVNVLATSRQSLINILQTLKYCPTIFYHALAPDPENDSLSVFEKQFSVAMAPIVKLILGDDPYVTNSVEEFLISFPKSAASSTNENAHMGHLASIIILDLISKMCISKHTTRDELEKMLFLLAEFASLRMEYFDYKNFSLSNPKILEFHKSGKCSKLLQSFEKAVYLGLFSDNAETHRQSRFLLSNFLQMVTGGHHLPTCFQNTASHLARAILSDKLPSGTMAMRKKLRDHLTNLEAPNEILLDIWNTMYERLKLSNALESGSLKSSSSMSNFDQDQYEDYADYLASLGGILMSPDFEEDPRHYVFQEKLRKFLNLKVINLFSSDPKEREEAREVLCVSMHPFLCGVYLDLLTKHFWRFESAYEKKDYHICEVVVSVLRTISQIDYESLFFHTGEFCELNMKMLIMMDSEIDNDYSFLKLKLKLCKLQSSFLPRLDDLSLNGNILRKNQYAKIIANYLENSFNYRFIQEKEDENKRVLRFEYKTPNASVSRTQKALQQDLNDIHYDIKVETSLILKIILFGLPLDASNGGMHGMVHGNLANEVAFSNYFNLFVRILEHLDVSDQSEGMNMADRHRSSIIVKNIIQALINLLKSNSDLGLKHSLPLGYHENILLRSSFINVFTSIVKNLSIQMNTDSDFQRKEIMTEGLGLVATDRLLLYSCTQVCPTSEVDDFAKSLLTLTNDKELELSMITSLLRADILDTSDYVEILRSNTVATRMVALYSHRVAKNYLVSIFKPIFYELQNSGEYFEIEKISVDDENCEENLRLFMKYFTMIVDAITNSVDQIPKGLRSISKTIYDTTSITFPESKLSVLGAFLFLRLFNPAIVSPEGLNILPLISVPMKRSLMQIARILQLLANESSVSVKIPLLQNKIEDLKEQKAKINKFMVEVTNVSDAAMLSDESENIIDESCIETEYSFFHNFLYDHWLDVRMIYSKPSPIFDVPMEERFVMIREIDNFLSRSGVPKRITVYEIPESIRRDQSERGVQLYDFMSQVSLPDRQFKPMIKESITRDGFPLVIVDMFQIYCEEEKPSPEILCYQLFLTSSKYWENPYCILIDCTAYNNDTLLSPVLDLMFTLLAEKYRKNLKRLYFFNVSHRYLISLKEAKHHFENANMLSECEVFFVSANEDEKALAKQGLTYYTNAVTKDARVTFHDVSLYQESVKRFVPVNLKIGNKFLQIFSAQPQKLKFGQKMKTLYLVDIYPITTLSTMSPSNFTGVANEISTTDTMTDFRLILTSSKKAEIMRTIYFSKSKYSAEVLDNEEDRSIEKSIGKLLNIILTGLLSQFDEVRNAAFRLLTAMTDCFSLSVGKKIVSSDAMEFPYGDVQYIFALSDQLAANHPQLTYDFLSGFFDTLDYCQEQEQDAYVIYSSPWIKNIFRYVYSADSIRGPRRTSDLIRKFVRASRKSKSTTLAFALYIWGELCLEDRLVEIVIDEIISAAIDHEAEGHGWEEITKYWPLTPTVEICGLLIHRLRERSYFINNDESELESHTRWIETTVLTRFLTFLVFDSIVFVQMYISDIFYLVTIYMDQGPLEFRTSILRLVMRAFHSFLSREDLTPAQIKLIREKIELFEGARYRMLFGLTRYDGIASTTTEQAGIEMVNKSHSIATVTESLISFLKDLCDPADYELHLIKWNSYVLNIAFLEEAQLQGRAMLVLGSLVREGVSYSIVTKFLKVLAEMLTVQEHKIQQDNDKLYMMICVLHSFTKLTEGVPSSSPFAPQFFWIGFALSLSDNVIFYQYSIKIMSAALKKVANHLSETDVEIRDYLFNHRAVFEGVLEELESVHDIDVTKEHFDVLMTSVCSKGLQIPFATDPTFGCLETLLSARYRESMKFVKKYHRQFDLNTISYAFYLFVFSQNDSELMSTLYECGMRELELVRISDSYHVPKVFLDYFDSDTPDVYVNTLNLCRCFNVQKGDETIIYKCLKLYDVITQRNPKIAWRAFNFMIKTMRKVAETSSSTRLLHTTLNTISGMITRQEYNNRNTYAEELLLKVDEAGLSGVKAWEFTYSDRSSEFLSPLEAKQKSKRDKLIRKLVEKITAAHIQEE
ncbi:hypothetical protein KL908_004416 [Ogataea polymorpha]|nr:hypothetical protein KL908_004416 [Ogataea polymorpha]